MEINMGINFLQRQGGQDHDMLNEHKYIKACLTLTTHDRSSGFLNFAGFNHNHHHNSICQMNMYVNFDMFRFLTL